MTPPKAPAPLVPYDYQLQLDRRLHAYLELNGGAAFLCELVEEHRRQNGDPDPWDLEEIAEA
jgi:hypothetical protein